MAWKTKKQEKAQDDLVARKSSLHLLPKASPPPEDPTPPSYAPSTTDQPPPLKSPNAALSDPSLHIRSTTSTSLPLLHNPDPPLYRTTTDPTPLSPTAPLYSPTTTSPIPKKPHKTLPRIQALKTTLSDVKTSIKDSPAPSVVKAAWSGGLEARSSFAMVGPAAATGVPGLVVGAGLVAWKVGKGARKVYKEEERERGERLVREGKAWRDGQGRVRRGGEEVEVVEVEVEGMGKKGKKGGKC
ncbi:hypothetical protein P171DRAFT_482020 [Karstenula rhodostoma CBS 690.94]|uniref:Uncharacterized protein n=1 Tax=Karstenula rhodostoma CBS 690.94 TaxID=1392251 RepID=A0A9P4PRB0_9PLEO|nr:hypothetical protein P171DRAFT_482020 [Karstenula rhodostoma CBS 690.94]